MVRPSLTYDVWIRHVEDKQKEEETSKIWTKKVPRGFTEKKEGGTMGDENRRGVEEYVL